MQQPIANFILILMSEEGGNMKVNGKDWNLEAGYEDYQDEMRELYKERTNK